MDEAAAHNKGVKDTIDDIRYWLSSGDCEPRYQLGAVVTAEEHLSNARMLLFAKLSELQSQAS